MLKPSKARTSAGTDADDTRIKKKSAAPAMQKKAIVYVDSDDEEHAAPIKKKQRATAMTASRVLDSEPDEPSAEEDELPKTKGSSKKTKQPARRPTKAKTTIRDDGGEFEDEEDLGKEKKKSRARSASEEDGSDAVGGKGKRGAGEKTDNANARPKPKPVKKIAAKPAVIVEDQDLEPGPIDDELEPFYQFPATQNGADNQEDEPEEEHSGGGTGGKTW